MRILTCLKQILDPDLPAGDFELDADGRCARRGTAKLVANIFCENAIETALKLREGAGGEITVLSYGTEEAETALRKALAMTVDGAVLVLRQGPADPDPWSVARVLAAAVKKAGEWDLVLVGRESGDWGVGQTGGLLAEELGLPYLSLVDRIEAAEAGEVKVRRQTDSGFETARCRTPAVLSITNDETNVPRIPKTRDVMRSARQPIPRWTLAELGLDAAALAGNEYYEVVELSLPDQRGQCHVVEGESLEDRVDQFAQRLGQVLARG